MGEVLLGHDARKRTWAAVREYGEVGEGSRGGKKLVRGMGRAGGRGGGGGPPTLSHTNTCFPTTPAPRIPTSDDAIDDGICFE